MFLEKITFHKTNCRLNVGIYEVSTKRSVNGMIKTEYIGTTFIGLQNNLPQTQHTSDNVCIAPENC